MAKVYRIHTEAQAGQNSDWFQSHPINNNLINGIQTGSGDGKKLPTSIPSPFARLDLVRTAFESVAETNLDGLMINGAAVNTDNHKLVSDALDIAQIFFNYSKFSHKLEIIAWDCNQKLNQLKTSATRGHRLLGETLDLFMQQDGALYNFNECPFIYILLYDGKPIGGTSPKTLFFAAPDAAETDIKFGQDTMLDDGLNPLYKRDPVFIKYLFALSQTPQFPSRFEEFYNYLDATKRKLQTSNPDLSREIEEADISVLDRFHAVHLNGNEGQPLEIINGLPVKEFVKKPADIEAISDFVIESPKCPTANKPLVLPTDEFQHPWRYTEDLWVSGQKVPPKAEEDDLTKRRLPYQNDLYPYLTIGDFLQDNIIKTSYPLDDAQFQCAECPYFLYPLTKLFFKFFSTHDLFQNGMINMTELAGDSIQVTLRIPVRNNEYITYNKIYSHNNNKNPNHGTIISKEFILALYPNFHCPDFEIEYHIALAHEQDNDTVISHLSLLNESKIIDTKDKARNVGNSDVITQHFKTREVFDKIELTIDNQPNFLIPRFKTVSSNNGDTFEFAIDFGTTNTHIECKVPGQGAEKKFSIRGKNEELISFSYRKDLQRPLRVENLRELLVQEMFDRAFGEKGGHQSPFRTVMLETNNIEYSSPINLFSDVNIGFDFERKMIKRHLRTQSNIKWAMDGNDIGKSRARYFIRQLIELCRNKALQNDGNIQETKIIWYYPVSMSSAHLDALTQIWSNQYQDLFQVTEEIAQNNLIRIPESISPLFYYKHNGGIQIYDRPTISVDIGGGTTDVLIYHDNQARAITSFRYAGNALYGNGLNGNMANNGFISKYLQHYEEKIEINGLVNPLEIINQLRQNNEDPGDIISFLFSLYDNEEINENNLNDQFNFLQRLKEDQELKLVFLIFYTSIIYHTAQILKMSGLPAPRNMIFSGTASKSLSILEGSNRNFPSLSKLFTEIFKEVLEIEDFQFTIIHHHDPKESTAKGGFYADVDETNYRENIQVHLGDNCRTPLQNPVFPNSEVKTIAQMQDQNILEGIKDNIHEFHRIMDQLNHLINFEDTFGVSEASYRYYTDIRNTEDISGELMEGLALLSQATPLEKAVPETLFFFPFRNLLYKLANHENV